MEVLDTLPKLKLDEGTGNTILLVASSKRGKSTIMREIYDKHYKDNKNIIPILISPSSHIGIFKDIDSRVIKINKFNNDTVQLIKDLAYIQNKTDNAYEFLIMIDDCIDVRFNKILNNLILVLRNSNFSTIISLQYDKLLSKQARSSVNNIICGGLNTDEAIESLLKSFFKSELTKLMKQDNEYLNKKIFMDDLNNKYREITDSNNGHTFIKYVPQDRDMEVFSLKI